jgi:hypothetical protein
VPRFLALVIVLLIGGTGILLAQNGSPRLGDPPVASLITISPADAAGIVTISGSAGAVFPGAQVAIRNLYTEQVVYTQAGMTGSFETRLFGPGNTPFWISPADNIPTNIRNRPGSLPGGPGTIIYGGFPTDQTELQPVTQIIIDGALDDWAAYPTSVLLQADGQTTYGLRNRESLYLALAQTAPPEDYWRMAVVFTLEGATYRAVFDPRLPEEAATWMRVSPLEADLGTLAVAKIEGEAVELRVPLEPLRSVLGAELDVASLDRFEYLAVDGSVMLSIPTIQPIPPADEVDGIVHRAGAQMHDPVRFTISGPVAQGAGTWSADGYLNQQNFEAGDPLQMQLDVTLGAPNLPQTLVGVSMVGQLRLQPIISADGQQATGGLSSNNGWSAVLTPSGMPIDNLRSDFVLGETIVPAPQVLRREDTLIFGLDFDLPLPEDLPDGVYGLTFEGFGQIADGERFGWQMNGLFGEGPGISRLHVTRLPLVLRVGDVDGGHLVWSLFYDQPSDGSRGVLAQEDRARAALSNRVRFNSPTYVLPPFADPAGAEPVRYPLEPYIVSALPNAYDSSGAPLIPFAFPGGHVDVKVTRPDGTVDDLGRAEIAQNQISTVSDDERVHFGAQSPLDVYRLATLNPTISDYQFTQYGEYSIDLRGEIQDVWGNTYTGGGVYQVVVAEMFDLTAGVLSGTPFEVGDHFFAGLQVSPGVPADVTITARIYPLDAGPVIEHVISGQANHGGAFVGENFEFTTPGEYVIDYDARYTDSAGRLWAGSLRSAGVIATPNATLIAHGRRGLRGYFPGVRPAWFTTRKYGPDSDDYRLMYPYQSGDVLWYAADTDNTVQPILSVQDTAGNYSRWLKDALANFVAPEDEAIDRKVARAELPVWVVSGGRPGYIPPYSMPTSEAYTYLSVVRPGLSVRQFVLGSNDSGLTLYWDMNDPYNEQIGSGLAGDLAGDFAFLFGGVVVRNPEAGISEAAIYGASAFVIEDRTDALGARVFPPYRGAGGAADGGPLLTVQDEPVTMFFHPTATRPGQVLTVGDTLAIAGQVAPTLKSNVSVLITSPSGEARAFEGLANAVGYFYDPSNDFTVEESGVWTVQIIVTHTGLSSAGQVQEPYPTGGMLGAEAGRFNVYVVPPDSPPLGWQDTRQDIAIPGALPYNFNFLLPEGWTNVAVDHTVTIPGFILRDGPITVSGASFSFQHNPTNLNNAFPNVEVDARLNGPAASDPVTLTFAVTGMDEAGQFQIRTRTFTILYDRLLTLE